MMRLLATGGGTGGHLYPALAVIEEFKRRLEVDLLYVGTKKGAEARVLPKMGIKFRNIWISGLHRRQFLRNLLFPLKMAVSFIQSFFIIIRFKPDLVIGTGGYVTWPVISAACVLRKKTALQEQNQYPGLVTRLLARHVDQVHVTYKDSKIFLKNTQNIILSGNPTRPELDKGTREEARQVFGLNPDLLTLFVFGGSQGALGLNKLMLGIIKELLEKNNVQILWGTGQRWYEWIKKEIGNLSKNIYLFPFIERMDVAYAATDLIVCRAGATTVAEINRLGIPAVYVPYPGSAERHQEFNAEICRKAGAAELIHEKEGYSKLLECIVCLLSDNSRRKSMAEQSMKLGKPDAAEKIVNHLMELFNTSNSWRGT